MFILVSCAFVRLILSAVRWAKLLSLIHPFFHNTDTHHDGCIRSHTLLRYCTLKWNFNRYISFSHTLFLVFSLVRSFHLSRSLFFSFFLRRSVSFPHHRSISFSHYRSFSLFLSLSVTRPQKFNSLENFTWRMHEKCFSWDIFFIKFSTYFSAYIFFSALLLFFFSLSHFDLVYSSN